MQNLIKNWNSGINLIPIVFILFSFISPSSISAQTTRSAFIESDTLQYEEVEYVEGDSTYVMKKYFLLTYLSGDKRDQAKEEADLIQKQHLAHMDVLASENKICIAGPFGHDGPERGIIIFNAYSIEEAEKLASQDPAVKAGRLTYTLHPIWLAKGSSLY